jgi:uncharacterized membrane protein HdeD (DUF308 family)
MLSYAIVAVGIFVGLVFFRKQTKKVLLTIALSVTGAGIIRLVEEVRNDQAVWPALLALSAMGVVWLVSWLLNRSVSPKRAPKAAAKTRSGPPRVDLR